MEQQIAQLQTEIALLKSQIDDFRALLWKKIGGGSADVKGRIVAPSTVSTSLEADSVAQAELDYEQVSVTVSAGSSSGTATVTSGSTIFGWRVTGNQDQFIDNMAVSGTTLTVTLAANATADNTFSV